MTLEDLDNDLGYAEKNTNNLKVIALNCKKNVSF